MRKIQSYFPLSLLTPVFVFLIMAIIMTIYSVVLNSVVGSKNFEEQTREVKKHCAVLSNQIMSGEMRSYSMNYPKVSDSSRIRDVERLADYLDGRILILDSHFKVITDTYRKSYGHYLINEETVSVMRGQGSSPRIIGNHFLQVITEIQDSEGEIQGLVIALSAMSLRRTVMNYMRDQRVTIISLFLLLVIICCLIVHIFLRKNFRNVQTQLDMINAGHQETALTPKGFKEFYQMSDSFNQVIDRYRELENSRQEFVSNVSHELKTPITSMKILADSLLLQDDVPVEYYKEFMEDIVHEIDRENSIITDLLALVRMDRSHPQLNIKPTNINELLTNLMKQISPIAAKRNISLRLETVRPVVAEVDEVKLSQACINVIENAVKYNEDGGQVEVSLNADHIFFYIKVKDSGCGIPEEDREQIFERFYRVDKTRSRETGGTGLGLAITKQVLLLHKGSISVESQEGQGSVFTLQIPLSYVEQ